MVSIELFDEDGQHSEGIFHVHKALICHYSPYFQDYFSHTGSIIAFMGTPKKVFGRFVEWIYTQELRDTSKDELEELEEEEIEGHEDPEKREVKERRFKATIECLMDLWIFSGCVGVPGLQNLAMDALEYYRGWLHSIGSFRLNELTGKIYQVKEEASKLHRWFISSLTVSLVNHHLVLADCPPQAIDDILCFLKIACADDELFVDQDTMRHRAAMMQFYVQDREMPTGSRIKIAIE